MLLLFFVHFRGQFDIDLKEVPVDNEAAISPQEFDEILRNIEPESRALCGPRLVCTQKTLHQLLGGDVEFFLTHILHGKVEA